MIERETRQRPALQMIEQSDAPLAERERPAPPISGEHPDFDFQDMVWGFFFAANLSGGNVTGAIAIAAGFVAQKQLRRDPTILRQARNFLSAAIPGIDELGRLALPSARQQLANHLPQAEPLTSIVPDEDELIRTLAEQPHRLIIGHTRGGKTTLIHHLATSWAAQGERVLVGDPDAAPGLWPGCEVRGYGDNIAAIGELLATVAQEVEARRQARGDGARRFAPLHLVIDEAQDVLPVLDGGLALFEDIARRGGKLNVRLTIGVQDKQVRTLGLQGKSELLRNFATADVLKTHDGRRVAMLRDPESGKRVSLPIPVLRDPESLIIVAPTAQVIPAAAAQGVSRPSAAARPTGSTAPRVSNSTAADLLAELLNEPVSSARERQKTPPSVSESVPTTEATDRAPTAMSVRLGTDSGQLTVNVNAHAEATPTTRGRARSRRIRGVNIQRRLQIAKAAKRTAFKAELQQAYEARKAAGVSYRKSYAELGGSSAEARAWWQAAPNPKGKR